MVSFWPFGKEDNSAASFEKTLSQLSEKINTTSARNDKFRHRQRKYKALWTIYTVFGYILIDIILILVTGWENWGIFEWVLVPGGPFGIYIVRMAIHAYYDYRLTGSQEHLADLIKQREDTLEKLKASTKYNSTQKLLEKYGGSPKSKRLEPAPHEQRKRQKSENGEVIQKAPAPPPGRTGVAPPPTANIPSRQIAPAPRLPQDSPRPMSWAGAPTVPQPQSGRGAPGEEFAPNAFASSGYPPKSAQQYAAHGPKWYDRLMDVILGEDETQAKNRIALICQKCRLVNGQAPPGAKTLEDVGTWRCSSCNAWNGVESEEKKVLKHAAQQDPVLQTPSKPEATSSNTASPVGGEFEHVNQPGSTNDKKRSEVADDSEGDDDEEDDSVSVPPADSTRSKVRQRRKV